MSRAAVPELRRRFFIPWAMAASSAAGSVTLGRSERRSHGTLPERQDEAALDGPVGPGDADAAEVARGDLEDGVGEEAAP